MNFDDMLTAWRTQDEAPLYGVNQDLLQLVLRHERDDLRRTMRWEQWLVYASCAGMLALGAALLGLIYYDKDPRTVWDYAMAVVAIGGTLFSAGAMWRSRTRQARRERGFGNSLREEIGRNLSLVEYQLSRTARRKQVLLIGAPIMTVGMLLFSLVMRINNEPFGWFEGGILFMLVGSWWWSSADASRKAEAELRPYQTRLRELRAMLGEQA